MFTGHFPRIVLSLAMAGSFAGCAQTGSVLPRRTTLGSLKTSLSHIEFENEQLRKKVAKLESDNREIENQLVQEEATNGDLSARLDDARNLLTRQGFDDGANLSTGTANRDGPAGGSPPAHTLPAGNSSRKPRKPPFARIPGRIDSEPPAETLDEPFPRTSIPSDGGVGPQSWNEEDSRWLPIARGGEPSPSNKVR